MRPATAQEGVVGHDVRTAREAGLAGLKNGELLRAAEGEFDALITVDKSIPYQQNVKALHLAVLVLIAKRNKYELLKPLIPKALECLEPIQPGSVIRIESPD
ncbi:MAG TPA: hypothetical protein VJH03_21485 [Blastocatellia bacterium]|nr:hypothetical protein [Blastocatellia bacterium]